MKMCNGKINIEKDYNLGITMNQFYSSGPDSQCMNEVFEQLINIMKEVLNSEEL